MSILEQIANTKQEMAALATQFLRGMSITEAQQNIAQYQTLERTLEDLRMHQQFQMVTKSMTKSIQKEDDWEYVNSSVITPQLHQFALHIVSQLFPQASPDEILEMVDELHDFSKEHGEE